MINITTDISVQFDALDPFFDVLHRDSSEDILFQQIRLYLAKHGIEGGYSLGKLGNHEEICLFHQDGYWIVAHSERGSAHFLGIFRTYYDATNFFIWSLTKKSTADMIDWKTVFE